MSKRLITLLVGTAVLAGASAASVQAASKRCEPGHFWKRSIGKCVAAGTQAKPVAMCMSFNAEGGVGSVRCSN